MFLYKCHIEEESREGGPGNGRREKGREKSRVRTGERGAGGVRRRKRQGTRGIRRRIRTWRENRNRPWSDCFGHENKPSANETNRRVEQNRAVGVWWHVS